MKQRDISIDILKFIAALIITNSHMELLYGKYGALATGGAIGDVLFFFASGFTLFLGRMDASTTGTNGESTESTLPFLLGRP